MDELEEIRKRKLAELQQNASQQASEEQEIQAQISQLETLAKQFLSREAIERYGNLKTAHPEKAVKVLALLGQMVQGGQIQNPINDNQFKEILKKLEPQKKEFRITRK